MITLELADYIKRGRAHGMSDEDLKSSLRSAGWSDTQINEALGGQSQTPISPKKHIFERYALWIGIGGIVIYFAAYLVFSFAGGALINFLFVGICFLGVALSVGVTMLFAKWLKGAERTFVKALAFTGAGGIIYGVGLLVSLLKLPFVLNLVIYLAFLVFLIFFLKTIYHFSWIRAFFTWLLSGISVVVLTVALMFLVGAGFFFSTFLPLTKPAPPLSNILPPSASLNTPGSPSPSGTLYTNPAYHYSLKYPNGWTVTNVDGDDMVVFKPNGSFPEEILQIQVNSWGYSSATAEDSMKANNTVFEKTVVNVGDVSAVRFVRERADKIGSHVSYGRTVNLYIPGKGKDSGELVVTGNCSTFGTKNSDRPCSTAIDGIMNNLVISSIRFE